MTIWPANRAIPDRGWFVGIGVSDTLPPAAGSGRIEWPLLDAAVRWCAVAAVTAGYVSVDETVDPSPVGMSPWEAATLAYFAPPHPTTTTRGVHWATYLAPAQWPTVDRASSRLPAGVARHVMDAPAGRAAWLTLGDDARARELPGKAALEEIVAPWLPAIPPTGFGYLGRG